MELRDCWLPAGWVVSHGSFDGTFVDNGGNLEGDDPGFAGFPTQDYSPAPGSPLVDAGGDLHPETVPDHEPLWQYVRHQSAIPRPDDGARDLGAFEAGLLFADGFETGDTGQWSATTP
jgi:hypothetical protein